MKFFKPLIFAAAMVAGAGVTLAAFGLYAHAFAQDVTVPVNNSTVVTVPIGDILDQVSTALVALAGTILAGALSFLPSSINTMIKTWRVDQVLNSAISYGINSTVGAAKGKTLTMDVGSEVVEKALQYVLDHGSPKIIKWMNDAAGVEQKIISRLDVAAEAAIHSEL